MSEGTKVLNVREEIAALRSAIPPIVQEVCAGMLHEVANQVASDFCLRDGREIAEGIRRAIAATTPAVDPAPVAAGGEREGASPSGSGSHASHEAPSGLRPAGFDPSRAAGLWCVHIIGPDDIIAAASLIAAVEMANEINEHAAVANEAVDDADFVLCHANVVPWPGDANAHANDLARRRQLPASAIDARQGGDAAGGSGEAESAVPRQRETPPPSASAIREAALREAAAAAREHTPDKHDGPLVGHTTGRAIERAILALIPKGAPAPSEEEIAKIVASANGHENWEALTGQGRAPAWTAAREILVRYHLVPMEPRDV